MGSHQTANPRLVVIEGKDKGKVIPLKKGTAILGRSKGDILVQDPRVSRSHVALHFDQEKGELSYTDLKSLNGVLVNGELKETGLLHDGDKLQLGNTTFDCQLNVESETEAGTRVKAQYELGNSDSVRVKEPKITPSPELTSKSFHLEPAADQGAQFDQMENADKTPAEISLAMKTMPTRGTKGSTRDFDTGEKTENVNTDSQNEILKTNRKSASLFLRLPKAVRIAALGFGLFFFVSFVFLMKPSTPRAPATTGGMEKELADVKHAIEDQKWDEAQRGALSLSSHYPSHSLSFMTLGDVYAMQKKSELAIDAYKRAHALSPPQPVLHAKLVRSYLSMDLTKDAEEEMKHLFEVLKSGPKESDIYIKIAELYLDFPQLKTEPEKVLVLARALQNTIAQSSTVGYKLEANLLLNEKSPQALPRLVETLEKGLKVDSKDEWLLEKMVFARLSQTDTKKAVEAVDTWSKIHPSSTKPMLISAYLKFNDKNYLGAIPYLQKVLQTLAKEESNPHYAEALHLMGQIYYQQNQISDAENFLKQACEHGFQDSCNHPLVVGNSKANKSPASETGPQ